MGGGVSPDARTQPTGFIREMCPGTEIFRPESLYYFWSLSPAVTRPGSTPAGPSRKPGQARRSDGSCGATGYPAAVRWSLRADMYPSVCAAASWTSSSTLLESGRERGRRLRLQQSS